MRIDNFDLRGINFFKKSFLELVFLSVALICSCLFMQLRFSLSGSYSLGNLGALVNGTAAKPFQYRILIPAIANQLYKFGFYPFNSLPNVFRILETSSVFFLIVSFRNYISLFIKDKTLSSLLSFLILYVLPFNFLFPRQSPIYYPYYMPPSPIYFPYDIPSILFFTLGLLFMFRRRWLVYYTIFIVATLNRETSCFLTLIYLFHSIRRERLNTIIFHCGAQLIIWIIIKSVLYKLFIYNPGSNGFEWYHAGTTVTHLSSNVSFLADPKNYPFLFSNLGFIWIPVFFYYRLIRVEFVKSSLLLAFPFFIGMLLIGNIYELRIFGELIPVFLTALLLILRELFIRSK
jgi:hypothetical protein